MSDFVCKHEFVILDACCVINLYATDRMNEILRVAPVQFAVASYVQKREALWVYNGKDTNGSILKQPIDLQRLVEDGLLEIVEPDIEVLSEQMVILASNDIPNGEMITGAIAYQRNWAIGTDDASASKKFVRLIPHLQIVSTLDLIKHWAIAGEVAQDDIRSVLQKMRSRAKFSVKDGHPHYEWSRSHL